MNREILIIPGECVLEVISVIRQGLLPPSSVSKDTKEHLLLWCKEQEEYKTGVKQKPFKKPKKIIPPKKYKKVKKVLDKPI